VLGNAAVAATVNDDRQVAHGRSIAGFGRSPKPFLGLVAPVLVWSVPARSFMAGA
jgi:hypothetical protein